VQTGRILAMSGGWSYLRSQYNRATQANRQPGSSFKPFVYLAAMQAGLTPSTMVLDAPIEISPGGGQPVWRPTMAATSSARPRCARASSARAT
jgi:penicillin-binding protein 1A